LEQVLYGLFLWDFAGLEILSALAQMVRPRQIAASTDANYRG
jgi:hypothetical protein